MDQNLHFSLIDVNLWKMSSIFQKRGGLLLIASRRLMAPWKRNIDFYAIAPFDIILKVNFI